MNPEKNSLEYKKETFTEDWFRLSASQQAFEIPEWVRKNRPAINFDELFSSMKNDPGFCPKSSSGHEQTSKHSDSINPGSDPGFSPGSSKRVESINREPRTGLSPEPTEQERINRQCMEEAIRNASKQQVSPVDKATIKANQDEIHGRSRNRFPYVLPYDIIDAVLGVPYWRRK